MFLSRIYAPADFFQEEKTIVLKLSGHREDIEYIVRSVAALSEKFYPCKLRLVCVDLGIDGETKKICQLLSRDFDFVKLVGFK